MSAYQLRSLGKDEQIRTKVFVLSHSSSLDPHQHLVAQ
jgi:hypothetical protein